MFGVCIVGCGGLFGDVGGVGVGDVVWMSVVCWVVGRWLKKNSS